MKKAYRLIPAAALLLLAAICSISIFPATRTFGAALWGSSSIHPSMSVQMGPVNNNVPSAPATDMGVPVGYGKCTFTQVNGTNSRTFILQGSNVSAAAGFSNDVSVTVTSDPSTWAFFFQDDPNEFWRGQCASGCGIGNEVTVECTFGGMAQ